MQRFVRYNRIWLPVAILLIVMLSLLSLNSITVQALALEQEARCGIEEHIHGQECYQGDKLVCGRFVHTHTENCYLILLKDNDINSLLVEVERQKDNSLETMIGQTVDNALMFNRNLTSPIAKAPEASTDVAAINDTITTYGIQPQVTFNEDLYKSTMGYDGDLPLHEQADQQSGYNPVQDTENGEMLPSVPDDPLSQSGSAALQIPEDPLSQPEDTGLQIPEDPLSSTFQIAQDPLFADSVYSLRDPAVNQKYWANFYVHLDGSWVSVGALEFDVSKSGNTYRALVPMADVLGLYNDALGTDMGTSDLKMYYASNANFTSLTSVSNTGSYYIIGSARDENSASNVKYVRLMSSRNTPISFYTVTFQYTDGTETYRYVKSGSKIQLPIDAAWKQGNQNYAGGAEVTIWGKTTFVERPSYKVTFDYLSGEDVIERFYDTGRVTLPDDTNWLLVEGETYTPYAGGTTLDVTGDMMFIEDNVNYATVTFLYQNGTEQIKRIRFGENVTLPADTDWMLGDTEYPGGTQLTVERDLTFTEKPRVYINYNVNFYDVSGVTFENKPTLLGSSLLEITDTVILEQDGRIRNVSSQEVIGKVNGHSANLSRVAGFMGWQIKDTDIILSPNTTLTWPELLNYAGSDYTIDLLGVWHYRAQQTASFYIRYDSVAVDINGNITSQDSNKYTPELFAAFVGGEAVQSWSVNALNQYAIADTTADNSYTADQNIRKLYGQAGDIWLQSFPRDEDIFEQLKSYAQNLRVDGEPVDVNDLNDKAYAIRWYVFKCQDDAWHIDGKLVKKEGKVDVTKTFAGNQDAIAFAKEGFYIEASNAAGDKRYYLYLDKPANDPQDGTVLLPSTEGSTYLWTIEGVRYGEQWTVSEATGVEDDGNIIVHSEYRVVDAENTQNKSGTGPQVTVSGMTYATDMPEVEALRVEFTNIYHTANAVIIKKADAATGQPLGGAVFSLMQNGEQLRFTYDVEKSRYHYDPEGDITELVGNGYYELVIDGFSYDNGPVEVQELVAPEGYTPVESILVGYREDGTIGMLSSTDMADFDNGLLTVRNSTDSTSVTVTKQWRCPVEEWQPVTVQLLANDVPVTTVIPGVEPSAELNAANGYTATWMDLPRYANGQEIRWSVRETRIGEEKCLSDFTFVNWLVEYGYPTYTYDAEGRLANTSFTVKNDTKRTLLRVIKTNLGGGVRLQGATFMLERLVDSEVDPDFLVRTQTTGTDGTLTFDNLKYGDYRLTELAPPTDYIALEEAAYLTIHPDGTVEVQGHPYVMPGSTAFSVQVLNQPVRPLPLTGGEGTGGYIVLGLLLMVAAICGMALPHFRRKGGGYPSG